MSVTTVNFACQKDYEEISIAVNKINSEIHSYNIKTVVKVVALAALCFALSCIGGISIGLILISGEIGITNLMVAALVFAGESSLIWFSLHQITEMEDDIGLYPNDINEKMRKQLNKFSPEVIRAFHIRKAAYKGWSVIPIKLESFEKVNERYPSQIRLVWERLTKWSSTKELTREDLAYWTRFFNVFF